MSERKMNDALREAETTSRKVLSTGGWIVAWFWLAKAAVYAINSVADAVREGRKV